MTNQEREALRQAILDYQEPAPKEPLNFILPAGAQVQDKTPAQLQKASDNYIGYLMTLEPCQISPSQRADLLKATVRAARAFENGEGE